MVTFYRIAESLHLKYDDLGYLTLDEIEDAVMKQNVDGRVIEKRKKHGCIITDAKLYVRDNNEYYKGIIDQLNADGGKSIIKGVVANPGYVKGKVTVIQSHHDIKKVSTGDIIVTQSTHSNYLPAISKAAAIVTNEGGMICHAAIVCREINKPCIVGTVNATRVLKTGDLVEVDADKGIVRKLEK